MSTPDARLNAAERAALADLEAAAAAADPSLAARLRGGTTLWAAPLVRAAHVRVLRTWAAVLRARWLGIPLTVAGILLMAIGLGAGIALSLVGAVIAAVGLRLIAETVEVRLGRRSR